jgi:NAD(P)-dependent dehydrogenase (short-subunit alcohol dehydrogenase family)
MVTFIPSKDMPTLPKSFWTKVFWNNQFRVKIELPTQSKYPNLEGKVAIITGANCGLGFESARQLLTLGLSHLVVAVRSIEKGKAAASKLRLANSAATVDVWALDMESYDSVQAFVHKCDTELSRIDYAILNAGLGPMIMHTNPSTGHETTIQVNHISTILLTILLLPVLKAKSTRDNPARLTVVNSISDLFSLPLTTLI